MSKSPWFKFETAPFLDGVAALTAAERGVYITLLALIYDSDGPINGDVRWLSRRTGMSAPTLRRVIDRLVEMGKLHVTDDGEISNKTARNVIEMRAKSREQCADAGRKSQEKQREGRKVRSTTVQPYKKKNKDNPQTPADAGASIEGMKEGAERDFLSEAVTDGADPAAVRSWSRGGFQIIAGGAKPIIVVDGMHDRFIQAFEPTFKRLGYLCWSRSYADARGDLELKAVPTHRARGAA